MIGLRLFKITLDEGEENFFVIAKNKYEAIGHLLKSGKLGDDESVIDQLSFWGEVEAKEGAVLD